MIMGQGQKKQEQNALNSTTGLKSGRFRLVTFDVAGENYRVSHSFLHISTQYFLFSKSICFSHVCRHKHNWMVRPSTEE